MLLIQIFFILFQTDAIFLKILETVFNFFRVFLSEVQNDRHSKNYQNFITGTFSFD